MNSTVDYTKSESGRPKTRPELRHPWSRRSSRAPRFGVGLLIAILLIPAAATAQQEATNSASSSTRGSESTDAGTTAPSERTTDVVLWLFRDGELTKETREAFRGSVRKALADADRRHLLSKEALRNYLDDRAASVPVCLKGLEPCVSPQSLVFDQLGLNALVRVHVRSEASGLKARYRLLDRRGTATKKASLGADGPKPLAFSLVRELFDATGTVALHSNPSGASVQIDGETMGTTPVQTRLPIGSHSYRLDHARRESLEGSFEISSGEKVTIRRELSKGPGTLIVKNAPEGATVYVDGEKSGDAGNPIELEPGSYEVEVRAEDYESYRETIEIGAGEVVRRNAPLEPDTTLLKDIASDAIAVNRYVARLTFDQSIHPTSFRDARATSDGTNYEFEGFTSDGSDAPGEEVVRHTLAPRGLRVDLSYTGRHFGVVGLSLSYAATAAKRRAVFETADEEKPTSTGTVVGLRRLQLRPFQLTYRRFFKNFVPSLELGTGITFQWLSVEGLPASPDDTVTFHQTEAFWTLGLAGQYFFNPNWFALLRYGFQDYFNSGKGVEHVLSLGVGAAYPDIFGFAPEPPEEL